MDSQRILSMVAISASFIALCVIGLGAFTRLIDAGLGCPDWPGCYGHFIAPFNHSAQDFPGTSFVIYKAWAEMVHRYFVGLLSFFILFIVSMIFIKKNVRQMVNIILACCLLIVLSYQIILGQWTVTLKLIPIVVTQHLIGGFLILSMLWLVFLNNQIHSNIKLPKSLHFLRAGAFVALILVCGQIFLGAWTSTNYASLSCPDFPFCTNSVSSHTFTQYQQTFNLSSPQNINYEGGVLTTTLRQVIQMTHRLGALILTLYIMGWILLSFNKIKHSTELVKLSYWVMGLLSIQLCLGISNVLFKLPLAMAISHTLIAVLLLLSVITFIFKLYRVDVN